MTIEKAYRAEDGDPYWEVSIAEGRFVTVRRSMDTGNFYLVEGSNGATVRDERGIFYRDVDYDAYEVIRFVQEQGKGL